MTIATDNAQYRASNTAQDESRAEIAVESVFNDLACDAIAAFFAKSTYQIKFRIRRSLFQKERRPFPTRNSYIHSGHLREKWRCSR